MMKNKKRNFLLIWILALALLLNVLAFVPVVAEGENEGLRNLADESDFEYTITYKANGKEIKEDTEIPAEGFQSLNVDVKFFIPDDFKLLDKDYFEIDLSGLSKIVDLQTPVKDRIVFEIEGEGGEEDKLIDAAKYSVTEGLVLRVEFDQNLDDLNDYLNISLF